MLSSLLPRGNDLTHTPSSYGRELVGMGAVYDWATLGSTDLWPGSRSNVDPNGNHLVATGYINELQVQTWASLVPRGPLGHVVGAPA